MVEFREAGHIEFLPFETVLQLIAFFPSIIDFAGLPDGFALSLYDDVDALGEIVLVLFEARSRRISNVAAFGEIVLYRNSLTLIFD